MVFEAQGHQERRQNEQCACSKHGVRSDCGLAEPPVKTARLAQSVERKALNLVVVGSSPTVGVF